MKVSKENLVTWLEDPITKLFIKWIESNKKDLKDQANEILYKEFSKSVKSEDATLRYSMCKGFDSILERFEDLYLQLEEESKGTVFEPQMDVINGLLNAFNGGEHESL